MKIFIYFWSSSDAWHLMHCHHCHNIVIMQKTIVFLLYSHLIKILQVLDNNKHVYMPGMLALLHPHWNGHRCHSHMNIWSGWAVGLVLEWCLKGDWQASAVCHTHSNHNDRQDPYLEHQHLLHGSRWHFTTELWLLKLRLKVSVVGCKLLTLWSLSTVFLITIEG